MNKLFTIKYIFITTFVLNCITAIGQTTYYYKLTKKIHNNVEYTNTGGGQFISFIDDICYDSDKFGTNVENGILKFDKRYSNISKTYIGNSYFGNTVYRFNSDMSILNIIINKSIIYVYRRATPPQNQITSSLVRKEKEDNSYSNQQNHTITYSVDDNYFNNNSNSIKNTDINQKQKTKVRKECAYCSGKRELIQHEYVSTFGITGPRVHCSICNKSWNYGTVHHHHRCNHCNGTGYYEYEY